MYLYRNKNTLRILNHQKHSFNKKSGRTMDILSFLGVCLSESNCFAWFFTGVLDNNIKIVSKINVTNYRAKTIYKNLRIG